MTRGPQRPLVVLAANPGANGGRAAAIAPRVSGFFADAGVDVVTLEPGSARETVDRAREALGLPGDVPQRPVALVVAGGDGAVHTGLQAVAGTPVPLGVIPIGSGNDIARDLGLVGATPRAAATAVLEALHAPLQPERPAHGLDTATLLPGRTSRGEIRAFDAVELSGDDGSHEWYLAILSAGIDAAINARTNELRWPPGGARYVRALLQQLGDLEPYGYRVVIDGVPMETSALLVAIGNLRHFGGGMRALPAADPTDGLLDVLTVDPVSLGELLRVFPRIYRGTHIGHPAVRVMRGREIRLEPAPGLGRTPPIAMADGEPVGVLPLTARIRAGAVRVVARTVDA